MVRQAKAQQSPPLRFRGLPQRLKLSSESLQGHESVELELPPTLLPFADSQTLSLPVRSSRQSGSTLRVGLARTTPPGRYPAELRLSGKTVPVEFEIAPAPRIDVFPVSVDFTGVAGADAEVELSVSNRGNMPVEIPERSVAGIFDDDGLELAFAETYREETDDPVRLLGCWLRSLRNGYGGLMKIRAVEGAGLLPPAGERRVRLSAHLPSILRRGHSYHGTWRLGPVVLRVTVAIRK